MQNDVLKNNIAPWQEKGRWYHAHYTKNGIDTAKSDKFLVDHLQNTASSVYYTLQLTGKTIIDYKYRINSFTVSSLITMSIQIACTSSGFQTLSGPRLDQFTDIDFDLWVFIM